MFEDLSIIEVILDSKVDILANGTHILMSLLRVLTLLPLAIPLYDVVHRVWLCEDV